MKRSYYKGIALDYTAQEYDDEYSLCNYCNKCYNDSFSTNTSIGSQSSEGFEKPTGGSKPRSSLDNPLRGLSADDTPKRF